MAIRPKTPQEYLQIYRDSVSSSGELRDFSEGSMLDILGGSFSLAVNEIAELMINEFRKTYFDTATAADLDALALDHFGPRFARPAGTPSTVEVTFTRTETTNAVSIPTNTALETAPDSVGNVVTFLTQEVAFFNVGVSEVTVDTVSSEVGVNQNVRKNTIVTIAENLPFSVSVTNAAAAAGGSDPETDDDYRRTVRNLITALAGATKNALQGALIANPRIGFVAVVEKVRYVQNYNRDAQTAVGLPFTIPDAVAYVADDLGNVNAEVTRIARGIVDNIRACGVFIEVLGARPIPVDITYEVELKGGSPLLGNLGPINTDIEQYILDIPIGEGLDRGELHTYITGRYSDITRFLITNPAANISGTAGQKLVFGTVGPG